MADSKYFGIPFATSGDRAVVPEAVQPSGAVSYPQGFGPDYERDPETDPLYKPVPRDETNELYYEITRAIKFLQLYGTPEWYALDDAGNAVSYPLTARVRYDAGAGMRIWQSLAATNTAVPGSDPTKWAISEVFSYTTQEATAAEALAATLGNKVITPRRMGAAVQAGAWNYAVASGGANALTAALTPAVATLTAGLHIILRVPTANTGAVTLTLNGVGPTPVRRADNSEMKAGDIAANSILPLVFDGSLWRADTAFTTDYLPLAGGTMTGPITLPGPPVDQLHATTKAYVDHPGYVAISSATTLTVPQLRKYVEVLGSGTFTITLPAPEESSTTGGMYYFCNVGSSDKTLRTPSGNFIGPNGSGSDTTKLPRGAFLWVVSGFNNWIVLQQSYSYTLLSSATTLTSSALGGYVQLGGATTYTITLPDPSNYSGASLEFYNAGSIAYTLRTPAGGTFVGPKGSSAVTVSIPAGEYFMLRAGNTNWIVH